MAPEAGVVWRGFAAWLNLWRKAWRTEARPGQRRSLPPKRLLIRLSKCFAAQVLASSTFFTLPAELYKLRELRDEAILRLDCRAVKITKDNLSLPPGISLF
jgi:hypothetical protein